MTTTSQPFEIPGFQVGHWTHPDGRTGCTVVLPDQRALTVADIRGGAPGTRETALLEQGRLVQRADAVLLTGGSAFGLAAADGVVRWLWEHGRGFPTGTVPVPIVPAAVLFDLLPPEPIWPDASAGYAAVADCHADGWVSGRLGAGAGATVAKLLPGVPPIPAGLGAARITTAAGTIAAIIAVNAVGEVVDPDNGRLLTARDPDAGPMELAVLGGGDIDATPGRNTTIGVVVVDATADRDALVRLAVAAHDGIARAIRPSHTQFDGDTVFVMTQREGTISPEALFQLTVATERTVAQAIANSVREHGNGPW